MLSGVSVLHLSGADGHYLTSCGAPGFLLLLCRPFRTCVSFCRFHHITLFLEISLRFTVFPCETTDGELQAEGFTDAHKKKILQTNGFRKQALRLLPAGLSPRKKWRGRWKTAFQSTLIEFLAGTGLSHSGNFSWGPDFPLTRYMERRTGSRSCGFLPHPLCSS